ncbi:MAG: ERF family protein [Clostridia bacterium]|nr:ERF family protein [Clostridia bacterium]
MNIYEKLANIQAELKVPKNQHNSFGGYNYRSCEDILETVKPLAKKHKAVVMISDELVVKGERYYVAAHAMLVNTEEEGQIVITAYAREPDTKKGMDSSQITGASSSYARKYALNGLFAIDDTKDKDTPEAVREDKAREEAALTAEEAQRQRAIKDFKEAAVSNGFNEEEQQILIAASFKGKKVEQITIKEAKKIIDRIVNDTAKVREFINSHKGVS